MNPAPKEYETRLDRKRRLCVPGARPGARYRVQEQNDGTIVLTPLLTRVPASIPEETLRRIDLDVKNARADIAGAPVDLT